MNEAGQRAAALTRQLLAFSRQSMLRPRIVDLNAIVAETGGLLNRLIGEDVQLSMALDPALQPTRLDPTQLDQVLMNLAINARDAMPHGGQLTIETANIELSAEYAASRSDCTAGPHVMLAITDTGTGMTAEVQSRIFEPFFTTKGVGRGTGLGLATVLGIVQQSGGCIHVYSEANLGTTFKVYFPAVASPIDRAERPAPVLESRGSETVLLVEDDAPVREIALNTLRERGYRILAAVDGVDALRVAAEHDGAIDMLLTDVVMPNASGPELATAIRERYPHVRVLFMSGYTDDAVVRHGLLSADVAFIQKPYAPSILARRVRETLSQPVG
jgi:CheY-like chemotaxis protein